MCMKKEVEILLLNADEIMEASQYVIFEKNEKMVGRTFRVMVDGFLPEENIYVGRTYGDAPEVDGCIFFECVSELVSGTIVPVQITDAKGYDLMGVIVSEMRNECAKSINDPSGGDDPIVCSCHVMGDVAVSRIHCSGIICGSLYHGFF